MALTERKIKIIIDKKGQYTLIAGEGFTGESCLEKTKNIEMALGGVEVDGGKTDSYYDGDEDPISINIDGL